MGVCNSSKTRIGNVSPHNFQTRLVENIRGTYTREVDSQNKSFNILYLCLISEEPEGKASPEMYYLPAYIETDSSWNSMKGISNGFGSFLC